MAPLLPSHRRTMEAHFEQYTILLVFSSSLLSFTRQLFLSSWSTVSAQQNKGIIMPVQSSAPAATAAVTHGNVDQNAAQITVIPEISSHAAKGAARNHMTDEVQRERQRT